MPVFHLRRIAVAALALAGAAVAGTALAHHSTAMFEWGSEKKMDQVTVERWVWTNPHTFLYVRDADGNRWAFEGMSPNHLSREGWSKRTLASGDMIDLTYYPLRDTRRGGFNVTVTKSDGKTMHQLPVRE